MYDGEFLTNNVFKVFHHEKLNDTTSIHQETGDLYKSNDVNTNQTNRRDENLPDTASFSEVTSASVAPRVEKSTQESWTECSVDREPSPKFSQFHSLYMLDGREASQIPPCGNITRSLSSEKSETHRLQSGRDEASNTNAVYEPRTTTPLSLCTETCGGGTSEGQGRRSTSFASFSLLDKEMNELAAEKERLSRQLTRSDRESTVSLKREYSLKSSSFPEEALSRKDYEEDHSNDFMESLSAIEHLNLTKDLSPPDKYSQTEVNPPSSKLSRAEAALKKEEEDKVWENSAVLEKENLYPSPLQHSKCVSREPSSLSVVDPSFYESKLARIQELRQQLRKSNHKSSPLSNSGLSPKSKNNEEPFLSLSRGLEKEFNFYNMRASLPYPGVVQPGVCSLLESAPVFVARKPFFNWNVHHSANVLVSPLGHFAISDCERARRMLAQREQEGPLSATQVNSSNAVDVTSGSYGMLMFAMGTNGVSEGECNFEVILDSNSFANDKLHPCMGVGLTTRDFCDRPLDTTVYVYYSRGVVESGGASLRYGGGYGRGDRVGVHLNLRKGYLSFSVNGKSHGRAFKLICSDYPDPLYPLVLFGREGESATFVSK